MKKTSEELGRKYRTVFIFFKNIHKQLQGQKLPLVCLCFSTDKYMHKKERIHQNKIERVSGWIKREAEIPAQC